MRRRLAVLSRCGPFVYDLLYVFYPAHLVLQTDFVDFNFSIFGLEAHVTVLCVGVRWRVRSSIGLPIFLAIFFVRLLVVFRLQCRDRRDDI